MEKIHVVKIGGTDGVDLSVICEEMAALVKQGQKYVVVHGGSKDANLLGEALNIPPQFITSPSGFTSRYTDLKTLEVFTMAVKGKVNVSIVSALQKFGVNAVGLSGMDGRLVEAERKKTVQSIENGKRKIIRDDYSGKITKINTDLLEWILNHGMVPVIAPIAVSEEGDPLNIDADRVAGEVAAALKAETLFLFTAVKGLMRDFPDETSLISKINLNEIKNALTYAEGRMKKKVLGAKEAIEGGVGRVAIGDGRVQSPIQTALNGQATWIGG